MVQVAAALLVAIAAGLGVAVIVAMVRSNADAILSALAGDGAFPIASAPQPGPASTVIKLRPSAPRHHISRAVAARPQFSRAA